MFDPIEILRILSDHQVNTIIVGGVAGTLAGSSLTTKDLDLVYDRSPTNVERLVLALQALDARYNDPAGRFILPDVAKLTTVRVNLLITRLGNLDLLQAIGNDLTYDALETRTIEYEMEDLRVRAIDLATLIEAKMVANRPKDLYALPFLRELLDLTQ